MMGRVLVEVMLALFMVTAALQHATLNLMMSRTEMAAARGRMETELAAINARVCDECDKSP